MTARDCQSFGQNATPGGQFIYWTEKIFILYYSQMKIFGFWYWHQIIELASVVYGTKSHERYISNLSFVGISFTNGWRKLLEKQIWNVSQPCHRSNKKLASHPPPHHQFGYPLKIEVCEGWDFQSPHWDGQSQFWHLGPLQPSTYGEVAHWLSNYSAKR